MTYVIYRVILQKSLYLPRSYISTRDQMNDVQTNKVKCERIYKVLYLHGPENFLELHQHQLAKVLCTIGIKSYCYQKEVKIFIFDQKNVSSLKRQNRMTKTERLKPRRGVLHSFTFSSSYQNLFTPEAKYTPSNKEWVLPVGSGVWGEESILLPRARAVFCRNCFAASPSSISAHTYYYLERVPTHRSICIDGWVTNLAMRATDREKYRALVPLLVFDFMRFEEIVLQMPQFSLLLSKWLPILLVHLSITTF